MLGKDGILYNPGFDFNGDGKLNAYEYSVMDGLVFGEDATDISDADESKEDLSLAGLDVTELECMDEDERK